FCAIALAVVAVSRAQLAATPWPMFHHGLTHTGLSPYDTSGNPGTLKWAFHTTYDVESSPAIGADGTIYFGSEDYTSGGSLYALGPDGGLKWRFLTSSDVTSSPAIG